MTASAAQLLLSALADLSVPPPCDECAGSPDALPGLDAVPGPLTSEPPMPGPAPLTSEPPLVDLPPLTSEPTALGTAGGGPSAGG
ncbi:hypothetical protein [Streptomyces sp. NPDC058953]|uniref:hypothetical protein n=1 Tax=unclassified Streptomyces TaxID=2593676 RepID=UPI00367B22E7